MLRTLYTWILLSVLYFASQKELLTKIDSSEAFSKLVGTLEPTLVYFYYSDYDRELNKVAARAFSRGVKDSPKVQGRPLFS